MNKVKKMLYSQKVAPYVFVLPFVISLLVFWLYPLISGIVMSFQDISFGGSQWVGLKHYQKLASYSSSADTDSDDACSIDGKPSYQSQRRMESDHVYSGTDICSYFRYVIPTDVLRR